MKYLYLKTICLLALSAVIFCGCKKNKPEGQKEEPKSENGITSFRLDTGQIGDAVITQSGDTSKITITVHPLLNLYGRKPAIALSTGATVMPASGETVNFTLDSTFTYTVTSATGEAKKWYVVFKNQGGSSPASKVAYKDVQVTNFFRRESGHIASDGGFSVPLSNGKVIWLFGDSHIDDYRASDGTIPWLFQVRNAAIVQPYGDWQWQHSPTLTGNSPSFKSYIKHTEDNDHWIWPGSGFQKDDTLFVYSAHLKKVSGGFGFGSGGPDMLAKITIADMKVVGFQELQDFNGINFGISFLKNDADGYTYVYGNKMTFIANDIFVARFPNSNPYAKWTFWTGSTFDQDITKIKRVGEAMSSGCQATKVNGKYVIVSTEFSVGCDQGKKIYISTSDNLLGPYTPNRAIYTIDDVVEGHYPFFYAPVLHPEYINSKGEVLLTYAINGYPGCLPDHVNFRSDPDRYRLKAVRIPYSVILDN